MCFSVFKNTRSIFPRLLHGEARRSSRKLFVKTIKALPENYLSYENFRSLLNYFMWDCPSHNAISLTSDELKILDSKINKEQENIPKGYASVSRLKEMYFKIDDQIEESDEANNKNEIIDINKIEIKDLSKVQNEIIDINKIEEKNLSENESKQYSKENQTKLDIEKEKNEFKEWASNKLKNNPLWHLIIWAFELWFNHKLETKLQNLSKKENLESAPNVNDNQNQNKGEDRVPNMQPTRFQRTIRRIS